MTLQEYLASGAVEDVRKLLAMPETNGRRRVVVAVGNMLPISDQSVPPWRCVIMADKNYADMTVYYRQTDSGFIVSDCGETVSEAMRRTGYDALDAHKFISGLIVHDEDYKLRDEPVEFAFGELHYEHNDLPAAIVAVLGAVAKCRQALDQDGGQ